MDHEMALAALNAAVPGWTKGPNTMFTNPATDGGIIDANIWSGKWFVIFNDEREVVEDLDTLNEAVKAFVGNMA